jgi:hypothetical protein
MSRPWDMGINGLSDPRNEYGIGCPILPTFQHQQLAAGVRSQEAAFPRFYRAY